MLPIIIRSCFVGICNICTLLSSY